MFEKLPSNSKKLLDDILQSDNPSEFLRKYYVDMPTKDKDVIRGIIRELIGKRFIDVKWADNAPYCVTIHNSARAYEEQLKEYESKRIKMEEQELSKIFISHRSTDKAIADAIFDFFVATGIPRGKIFCSSLPGNDVEQKISVEVKNTMKNSCVNIAILSNEYYQSAYCLNEAGIIWFQDVPAIPIALPEIEPSNMIGFLDSDYKIRRLDNADDIAYIYDTVCEEVSVEQAKASVVTAEFRKLTDKYNAIVSNRAIIAQPSVPPSLTEITTDDERIVLYYLLSKQIRKANYSDVHKWLQDMEIYDVNIENAFDLLSTLENGNVSNKTLELCAEVFRKYSSKSAELTKQLFPTVKSHIDLSSNNFLNMWEENSFNDSLKLFVAYIVDERVDEFGDRWMADGQIEDIKNWESKNELEAVLSKDYGACLSLFIHNKFVYESDWTSHGNARTHTLCVSLKDLLFNKSEFLLEELQAIKDKYHYELPF